MTLIHDLCGRNIFWKIIVLCKPQRTNVPDSGSGSKLVCYGVRKWLLHRISLPCERSRISVRRFSFRLRRGLFVLWGGWGERKREHAGHDVALFASSPARFLFFRLLIFWWGYPAGASAKERVASIHSTTYFSGGKKRRPEIHLISRSQAKFPLAFHAFHPYHEIYQNSKIGTWATKLNETWKYKPLMQTFARKYW